MKTILRLLVSAFAIIITAYLLPAVSVSGFITALIIAVVLGAINTFIRPVLVLLTLPLTVMTLGLFLIILNTLLIMLTAVLVPGFTIASFWWALAFGIILSVISAFLHQLTETNHTSSV